TDPTDPAAPGGTRKGPFFEFQLTRLNQQGGGFYQYLDPHMRNEQPPSPYYYFSSYGAGNDYHGEDRTGIAELLGRVPCPYRGGQTGRYLNEQGFQILSAGRDCRFGLAPDGKWDPAKGYGPGVPGSDDQANFSQSRLGEPQT